MKLNSQIELDSLALALNALREKRDHYVALIADVMERMENIRAREANKATARRCQQGAIIWERLLAGDSLTVASRSVGLSWSLGQKRVHRFCWLKNETAYQNLRPEEDRWMGDPSQSSGSQILTSVLLANKHFFV
jgi:hypothetical protein